MEPKIRKNGFSGNWERKTLSELLTISTEQNKKGLLTKDDVLSVSDEFGVVNQIKHLGRSYAGNNLTGYKILRKNQIAYTKSPLKSKPFGIFKVNDNQTGIVSVLYGIYNVKNEVYPKFIDRYFEPGFRTNNYLLPLINKGAKNTINISDETAISGKINIPHLLDEQTAICEYFDKLDSLIQSTTNKIESLKQVKSASLQSMFPQVGETKPRIRFKGFEGDWENIIAAKEFKTVNKRNRPDLPVLSATQDKGMVTREAINYNVFHDKSNEATYKLIMPGQFVIHLRSFQGGFAHSNIEGIASPAYTVMEFKNKERHCDLFWKYIFMSKEFIKRLELITYGIRDGRSISFEEFAEMNFIVPSYDEQKIIASYFTNLDKEIRLYSQKLEKLKQIKSACLDNMFV